MKSKEMKDGKKVDPPSAERSECEETPDPPASRPGSTPQDIGESSQSGNDECGEASQETTLHRATGSGIGSGNLPVVFEEDAASAGEFSKKRPEHLINGNASRSYDSDDHSELSDVPHRTKLKKRISSSSSVGSTSTGGRSRGSSDAPGGFYATLLQEKEAYKAESLQAARVVPRGVMDAEPGLIALAMQHSELEDALKKPDPSGDHDDESAPSEPALVRGSRLSSTLSGTPGAFSMEGINSRLSPREIVESSESESNETGSGTVIPPPAFLRGTPVVSADTVVSDLSVGSHPIADGSAAVVQAELVDETERDSQLRHLQEVNRALQRQLVALGAGHSSCESTRRPSVARVPEVTESANPPEEAAESSSSRDFYCSPICPWWVWVSLAGLVVVGVATGSVMATRSSEGSIGSVILSAAPSMVPSGTPTSTPQPTAAPSSPPSLRPTISTAPSSIPSSAIPTISPKPTISPTGSPTGKPSPSPSQSVWPTPLGPTAAPTSQPTLSPSARPSPSPTRTPTTTPTEGETVAPTKTPTKEPTRRPTRAPTGEPSPQPSPAPTPAPSPEPSPQPTPAPSPSPTSRAHKETNSSTHAKAKPQAYTQANPQTYS